MMSSSLTHQRATARAALLAKVTGAQPAPENPGVDSSLKEDTLTLYNAIAEKIGMKAFGTWITMEHPYLLLPHVGLLRVWWCLQRFHDELMGIDHRGWCIVATPAAWVLETPGAEVAEGLRGKGAEGQA